MKILQLVKTSNAAVWALKQMKELVQNGYEVHVAMPSGGKYMDEYKEFGIIIHPIIYSLKSLGKSIQQLRRIVNEVKPDIIHSHFFITTIVMRLGLRDYDIPRVFQLPGPSHLYYSFLKTIDIAIAQKKRDYWIGSCKYSCEVYLKAGIAHNRVFLSYYLGDPIEEPSFKDEKKLRHEMGLPDSAIIFGMISYMYPPKKYLGQKRGIKGHEDFIEAISIASKVNSDIYGICIGGAWNGHEKYEKQIHDFAKKKTDHIVFCGTKKNIPQIYPELFCAVQPSIQENLGGAAQAFRHKCPIIATNTGGLPDIVIDDVTGFLVPPNDPKALADAMLKMVANPQKGYEMMMEGRRHYMQIREDNKGMLEKIYAKVSKKN